MKKSILILFTIFITTIVTAQTDYELLINDANQHFENNNYIEAYKLYILIADLPEAEQDELDSLKTITRNKINELQISIQATINETDSLQRQKETIIVENAIKQQQNLWEENNDTIFNYKYNVTFLDLSFYGIIQLPEKVGECQNLKTINLTGNYNLDTAQAFTVLNKCKQLVDIKIDSIHVEISIDSIKIYQQKLYELTYENDIKDKDVSTIIIEAYKKYEQGKFMVSLEHYDLARRITNKYNAHISELENIVLKIIELNIEHLKQEKEKGLQVQQQTAVQKGINLFNKGNYQNAILEFQVAHKTADNNKKRLYVDSLLTITKNCNYLKINADKSFNEKEYEPAVENYRELHKANENNLYAT